jgi:protein-tyrosine-phosphatase
VTEETPQTLPRSLKTVLKDVARKFVPNSFLQYSGIKLRLGPQAGRIYGDLWMRDRLGVRTANQRLVPPSARSFVFVCYGNIMRSAMAEFLMRQALNEAGLEPPNAKPEQVRIVSAGLHASAGREGHPWAQQAAADLGVSLANHRAKPLTREMVEQADCVLAMDFQNKAELLTLYPEAKEKIYMLSAYAEGPWQYREIPDPYLADLEGTRFCGRQLRICVRNLISSTLLSAPAAKEQPVSSR